MKRRVKCVSPTVPYHVFRTLNCSVRPVRGRLRGSEEAISWKNGLSHHLWSILQSRIIRLNEAKSLTCRSDRTEGTPLAHAVKRQDLAAGDLGK